MQDTVRQHYASLRRNAPPATAIVLLQIGQDQTWVATGVGAEADQVLVLAMGASRTSTEFFHHSPPLPLEIENAIMVVEDEVNRARAVAVDGAALYSSDERIQGMARMVGGPDAAPRTLRTEQVEALFNQLAARSEGRPASQVAIPDDPRFAATLLIVREFMHHLHFDSITLTQHLS